MIHTEDAATAAWLFCTDDMLVDRVHLVPLEWRLERGGFEQLRSQGVRLNSEEVIIERAPNDPGVPLPPLFPPADLLADGHIDFMTDMAHDDAARARKRHREGAGPAAQRAEHLLGQPDARALDPLDAMLAEMFAEDELGAELRAIIQDI